MAFNLQLVSTSNLRACYVVLFGFPSHYVRRIIVDSTEFSKH